MMSLNYVGRSLKAAAEMALFRGDSMRDFDVSYEGFYRSFAAMLIAAPLYPLIVLGERTIVIEASQIEQGARLMGIQGLTLAYCVIEAGSYVASWLLFPLAMLFIARLIGVGARYVPFIVAYNWGTCIVLALTAAMHLLHLVGIVSLEMTAFLYYPVVGFALAYRWWIARKGLEVPGSTAAGVVILDVLLSVLLAFAVGSIHEAVGGL